MNSGTMHVLVVDDDPGIRSLVRLSLVSEGWIVATAGNGLEALEVLASYSEKRFNLIILDVQMPAMDGPTFYRELRALEDDTPVLMLSANDAERARREVGANAAMAKPFDPFILIERARELAVAS